MIRTIRFLLFLVFAATAILIIIPFAKDKLDCAAHPRKYSEYVSKYSKEYNVPEPLIYAVIKCESSFRPDARSSSDARGLMQMKPSTFADLCNRLGEEHDESMLYDPEISIKYGTYYLSLLYGRFDVWETAVAAYNAGQGRVAKWIEEGKVDKNGHLTSIPIEETQTYVKRVNKANEKYKELYYQ